MAISPYTGKFHVEWYPKKVSTVMTNQDLVYLDSNGFVAPAVDDAAIVPIGLIQKSIAATDSDYASTTDVPVLVGDADSEYLVDVGNGSAATTDIGEWCDVDGTYPDTKIDVAASSYDIWFVTKIVSTSKVVAKLAKKSGSAA